VEFFAKSFLDAVQSSGVPQRTAILGLSKALSTYFSSIKNEADLDRAIDLVTEAIRSDWAWRVRP
jgi:hypothetical protein